MPPLRRGWGTSQKVSSFLSSLVSLISQKNKQQNPKSHEASQPANQPAPPARQGLAAVLSAIRRGMAKVVEKGKEALGSSLWPFSVSHDSFGNATRGSFFVVGQECLLMLTKQLLRSRPSTLWFVSTPGRWIPIEGYYHFSEDLWSGRTGSRLQMHRLSLRNDRLRFIEICRKIYWLVWRNLYRIYPSLMKGDQRMSTCNRLDLQTRGSQPMMHENIPDRCKGYPRHG